MMLVFLAAAAAIAAIEGNPAAAQPRYQLHVLSPTEALVIDTYTGCLDRVRIRDTDELVTPVTGYPDEDAVEEALRGNTKAKRNADGLDTHSCLRTNRIKENRK